MPPVVYVLHGEDEFAIAQYIQRLQAKQDDPNSAALNSVRLDGRSASLDELRQAAFVISFMVTRRIVVVDHPLARVTSPAQQEKYLALLDQTPESTALVLAEYRTLQQKDTKEKKKHWLLRWAETAGERVIVEYCPAMKPDEMQRWIIRQAKEAHGEFTPKAAENLASLVGDDSRMASQEIEKLLAYAGYTRRVEAEDVAMVGAGADQADVFVMVDALGRGDAKTAQGSLRRLLAGQDALSLLGMIVRQFRLLLLTREVIERGGGADVVAREVRVPRFVADKITAQARRFSLPALEAIYRQLMQLDEAIKTGQMEGDVALETFTARITNQVG
jgi:DNA polymerase-3 subunit delta